MGLPPADRPAGDPATDANTASDAAYCADFLRRHDRERYLIALFAPEAWRRHLIALDAFGLELARIGELVSEPMLGEIRLQWWRESLDGIYAGSPRRHAVVRALGNAVAAADLPRAPFEHLIDARARDLDAAPFADLTALESYASATAGPIGEQSARLLGAPEAIAAATDIATGHAIAGLLRATAHLARRGRVVLPTDLLAAHRIAPGELLEGRCGARLAPVVKEVADRAGAHLGAAATLERDVRRRARAVLLPAVLARDYLRRLARAGHDPFAPGLEPSALAKQLRLFAAAALGRA